MLGAIGRVREEHLNTEHREPTGSELRDKVTELLVAQTRGKILDKPDGSGAKLDDAQLDAAITRKLTKDGIAAALADFDAVRLESLPVLGLVESDDENVWNVPPLTVDEPDADAGDPERKFEELLRVALGDQHWARAALQADDPDTHAATAPGGATPRTLRETLARARGRVTAPHAQFAHLAAYRVHDS